MRTRRGAAGRRFRRGIADHACAILFLALLAAAGCSTGGCFGGGGRSAGSAPPAVEPPTPKAAPPRPSISTAPPLKLRGGDSRFLAGAASRVITPDLETSAGGVRAGHAVRVAGFRPGADATAVNDDLYARALVLEAGGLSVAFVALDLIGLFHDDVALVREEIRARYPEAGIGYVLVASTHTHAGPDVIGLWTPPDRSVDSAYVARVRSAAAGAVHDAWRARRPARISFASARLPDLVRDTRLPRVIDDRALLMKVDAAGGGGTIATLINFANHPEALGKPNTRISSDYPAWARRALEEAFGGVAIFTSGAVGGLMTPLGLDLVDEATGEPIPHRSVRMAEAVGRRLGEGLARAWREGAGGAPPDPAGRGSIAVDAAGIAVPLLNQRFVRGLVEGRIWPRAMDGEGRLTSEVAVVTLRAAGAGPDAGPPLARFACVPGEIYPELVDGGIEDPQDPGADLRGAPREPALRAMMPARHQFVLGLCNDELGYIIPASQWDVDPPYAYGRTSPQYGEVNSAGPDTARVILEAFSDLLR